jgi:ubiquinone/menaquinone biosynthesis C-methylase UbiE
MQGDFFSHLTEDVLRQAGICTGMQVLDVGCGVGDVSLLVRRLVGAEGSVLGIDRGASSAETARPRAAMAGMANLRFETADLFSFLLNDLMRWLADSYCFTYPIQ